MDDFETRLRSALEREGPREGFSDRVLARLQEGSVPTSPSDGRRRWVRRLAPAIAAAVVAMSWGVHQIQERRRGEEAREQVLIALRIASSKVNIARQEVLDLQQPGGDPERKRR